MLNSILRRFFAGLVVVCFSVSAPLLADDNRVQTEVLSAEEVAKILDDERWVLVDTRDSDAFNGWKLGGVSRGGHLPGAVDFPASWLDSKHADSAEILATALRSKGIDPTKNLALYSDESVECTKVADYLRELGYEKLYELDFGDWEADPARPLIRYARFDLLVPPAIVSRLLNGELPETFESAKRVRFAEVSWGDENASYSKGHVPKSFHVNTDDFEPPPTWYLGDQDVLLAFAKKYGFRVDDTVILSGEDPTASYRLAIVLRYMGVEDVRVLNGGFNAWKAAGFQVENKSTMPVPAESFGAEIPRRSELIIGLKKVKQGLARSDKFTLVDNRNWAEFTGKTSGYTYHSHKGRIPGSVFGQADFKGQNSLDPYRNIDNTMRNAEEILDLWKRSGIETQKHLSFMCGGGWRAAEVLTYANVIGLQDVSLYSDGWIGWSNAEASSK